VRSANGVIDFGGREEGTPSAAPRGWFDIERLLLSLVTAIRRIRSLSSSRGNNNRNDTAPTVHLSSRRFWCGRGSCGFVTRQGARFGVPVGGRDSCGAARMDAPDELSSRKRVWKACGGEGVGRWAVLHDAAPLSRDAARPPLFLPAACKQRRTKCDGQQPCEGCIKRACAAPGCGQ
jgi:hypothetical protein